MFTNWITFGIRYTYLCNWNICENWILIIMSIFWSCSGHIMKWSVTYPALYVSIIGYFCVTLSQSCCWVLHGVVFWGYCHFQLLTLSAVTTRTRSPLPIISLHPHTALQELQLHVVACYSWGLNRQWSGLWCHLRGSCFFILMSSLHPLKGAGRVLSNSWMLRKCSLYVLNVNYLTEISTPCTRYFESSLSYIGVKVYFFSFKLFYIQPGSQHPHLPLYRCLAIQRVNHQTKWQFSLCCSFFSSITISAMQTSLVLIT